jgi:hypothetical protein
MLIVEGNMMMNELDLSAVSIIKEYSLLVRLRIFHDDVGP